MYPIIFRVSYIPGGAGFQPSTACFHCMFSFCATAPCQGGLSAAFITQLPWDMPWWAPDLFEDQRREFPITAQLKLEFVKVSKGFPFMLIVKFGTEEIRTKDWLIETNVRTSHMLAFQENISFGEPDFRTHQHYAWTGIPPLSTFCTILWIWIISFIQFGFVHSFC